MVMIALLSLLAAGYTFMVRAHMSTVIARNEQYKARMAAEAGIQRAIVTLRETPGDVDSWYDNEEDYRGALVQGGDGTEGSSTFQQRSDARSYDQTAKPVWRYSLYGPNYDKPKEVRYGFTDESARLDINLANDDQLRRLFDLVIPQDANFPVDVDVLVDSLLDWRSRGNRPRPNGAKDDYYQTLDPPYRSKSAPFSTVEELLLVRGFTAWVVYGEDYNQNGLLDPNEDDGDISFPPDNADGELFRGVASYLTVWSQEMDTTADNSPRINLNMRDLDKLQKKLDESGISSDVTNYIMEVRQGGIAFNSVMNLIPAPSPTDQESADATPQSSPTSTQPSGSDATSQPDNGNPVGLTGSLTDQNGANSGSENQGAAGSEPVFNNLTDVEPPGTYDELPQLLDLLTVSPSPFFQGRINVSTAPLEVLSVIRGLTEQEAMDIQAARRELRSEDKSSPAWLLTRNVISETVFRVILDRITTKSSVFRIESVGYADHVGVVERILMVLQMRGPIPQILYYRNLNPLGVAYNPYGDERRELANRSK